MGNIFKKGDRVRTNSTAYPVPSGLKGVVLQVDGPAIDVLVDGERIPYFLMAKNIDLEKNGDS